MPDVRAPSQADQAIAVALKQFDAGDKFRKPRLDRIVEIEDMYQLKTKPALEWRFGDPPMDSPRGGTSIWPRITTGASRTADRRGGIPPRFDVAARSTGRGLALLQAGQQHPRPPPMEEAIWHEAHRQPVATVSSGPGSKKAVR